MKLKAMNYKHSLFKRIINFIKTISSNEIKVMNKKDKNGLPHGYWEYDVSLMHKLRGNYINGKREGKFLKYISYNNTIITEYFYTNDVVDYIIDYEVSIRCKIPSSVYYIKGNFIDIIHDEEYG